MKKSIFLAGLLFCAQSAYPVEKNISISDISDIETEIGFETVLLSLVGIGISLGGTCMFLDAIEKKDIARAMIGCCLFVAGGIGVAKAIDRADELRAVYIKDLQDGENH